MRLLFSISRKGGGGVGMIPISLPMQSTETFFSVNAKVVSDCLLRQLTAVSASLTAINYMVISFTLTGNAFISVT